MLVTLRWMTFGLMTVLAHRKVGIFFTREISKSQKLQLTHDGGVRLGQRLNCFWINSKSKISDASDDGVVIFPLLTVIVKIYLL